MNKNSIKIEEKIFQISTQAEFNELALEVFLFQYKKNSFYRSFIDLLGVPYKEVNEIYKIPFLPIGFFKSERIIQDNLKSQEVFLSSGTTGAIQSKHHVADVALYTTSFSKAFELFYGKASDYCIIALLPSYLEREGSSLIYMANDLIGKSQNTESGFYLNNMEELISKLLDLKNRNVKTLLIGVTYALLDLAERIDFSLSNTIIMETGGMKGKRKEMVREELHTVLCKSFGVSVIHSEYGMTELLSQGYSYGNGVFITPPWMKILIRDINDPLSAAVSNKAGGINVIDLANLYSCSFIATQDLGKINEDGTFEVLGRFDNSDVRGCNLMAGL